ncbi:MAG: DUF2167 domain-containing protein [Proteobacteria bacterium]|nr:DUF2167 domain-containing protein [Pseudomonadota bacterium]
MRKNLTHALLAAVLCLAPASALADGRGSAGANIAAPPTQPAPQTSATSPAAGRTGQISLMNGELSLNVPPGWKFYPAEEAYAFLQRTNAAAPSGNVLGLLAKANVNPRQAGTWATVVSYDAIGYVQPETASGLADPNFEGSVRSARSAQSRPFEGFAAQPVFDASTPNLLWAERTASPGAATGTDLRVEEKTLGRYGVATLTSVGSADQQPDIMAAAAQLKSMLSFPDGRKASDFQAAADHVSSYSVPGLVTGVPAASAQALAGTPATTGGQAQTAFGGFATYGWIAAGIAVLAALGFVFMRRKKPESEEGGQP